MACNKREMDLELTPQAWAEVWEWEGHASSPCPTEECMTERKGAHAWGMPLR